MEMLNNYILVDEVKSELSSGGIHMPGTVSERFRKASVVVDTRTGPEVGDMVIYDSFSSKGELLEIEVCGELRKLEIIRLDQLVANLGKA